MLGRYADGTAGAGVEERVCSAASDDDEGRAQAEPSGRDVPAVRPRAVQAGDVLVGGLDDVGECDEVLDPVARIRAVVDQAGADVRIVDDRRRVAQVAHPVPDFARARLDVAGGRAEGEAGGCQDLEVQLAGARFGDVLDVPGEGQRLG